MPDPSNTSFIPKRSPKQRSRRTASRQVYVFTLISYTLIFASLIASASVFFYHRYLENQQSAAIAELDAAIASFSTADMERVLEVDNRLAQAWGRLDTTASGIVMLESLEAATVGTVEIEQVSVERQRDEAYVFSAKLLADSFDSALFQRGVLEGSGRVATVTVENLALRLADNRTDGDDPADLPPPGAYQVAFDSEIHFPLSEVGYQPQFTATSTNVLDFSDQQTATPTSTVATTTEPVENVSNAEGPESSITADNQTGL